MEEILKSILKTETAAEDLFAKAGADARKIMDKAESDAAAVQKEFAVKTEKKVKEIIDGAMKEGEALRGSIMKKAQDDAKAILKTAESKFKSASKICLDYLLGR